MDLSKIFDFIPQESSIAKIHAYGFDLNTPIFVRSYLKYRKQNVKVNNACSIFQILLSSVPQGSTLGPILFKAFINDVLMSTKSSELHSFADDNTITITSYSGTLSQLIKD